MFFGELALDRRLRPVPGVLPAVAAAAPNGLDRLWWPSRTHPRAPSSPAYV
jgi:predicted ATPase with chaperone activity